MKMKLITALCTATVAAVALPAFADHTIAGYARTNFVSELFGEGQNTAINQAKDPHADTVINERIRARWQNNINEYVNVVLFGEVDTDWGQAGKGPGNGGKQGADGVNIEIKHAYFDVKVPSTPVAFRLGSQPISDAGAFNGVVMDDDMSGLRVDVKTDMASVMLGWMKLDEGVKNKVDDSDLYILQASLEPVKGLKLQPQAWWAVNQRLNVEKTWFTGASKATNFPGGTNDLFARNSEYYVGLGASYALAPLNLSGWFLYDGGKATGRDLGDTDFKVSAWAASAKAEATVAGAKVGLRGLYFPKQSKDITNTKNPERQFFLPPNNNNGGPEFGDEGSLIFLADLLMTNTSTGRIALQDAAYTGFGLMGVVASASYTPPPMPQLYAKASLGYYTALTASNDKTFDFRKQANTTADRDGKDLGTEIAGAVGYKVAEKVDVQLRGGYGFLGKFYNKTNAAGDDPKNVYKLGVTVNIPY
jgi:hypothetical protein